MNNVFSRLVAHFGTQQQAADALGVNQSTISGWLNGKWGMSARTAILAEERTDRAFRREDLCPDFPWERGGHTCSNHDSNIPTALVTGSADPEQTVSSDSPVRQGVDSAVNPSSAGDGQ